jgi:hypothetical protein
MLALDVLNGIEAAGRAAQDSHLIPARHQRPRHMRSDKSGSASYQCGDHRFIFPYTR